MKNILKELTDLLVKREVLTTEQQSFWIDKEKELLTPSRNISDEPFKLVSLNAFALEKNDFDLFRYNADTIRKYAIFLNLKLKKWMFVPCDSDGYILKEPHNYFEWSTRTLGTTMTEIELDLISDECQKFKEAKDKVIFEGCSVKSTGDGELIFINDHDTDAYVDEMKDETIGDLLTFCVPTDWIVTSNAMEKFL